jgi:hypothetical protein
LLLRMHISINKYFEMIKKLADGERARAKK